MGGQVDMMFATAAAVSTFIDNGKLRVLGVTTAEPSAAFKNVPPIAVTVPGYRVESWYGLYPPAAPPPPGTDRLNPAPPKPARSPESVRNLEPQGPRAKAGPAAELDPYVQAEEKRWAQIVKQNNIHPD